MRNVAVLGATGLVGQEVIKILEQRNFLMDELFPFASERSEGQKVIFRDREFDILAEYESFLDKADIVFGCLDTDLSREIVPKFAGRSVVIDNSAAYREDPDVPLVIPEVNPQRIKEHKGIIANPNCSTIQMLVPLWPLHKKFKIRRIFVATYQSVSGYGKDAIEELQLEHEYLAMGVNIEKFPESVFPHPIGANVIPQIGDFDEAGYTKEENKMINETRKIFEDNGILVSPTCVRVPVLISHSEAVSIDLEQPVSVNEAKELLKTAPGVVVLEEDKDYPVPVQCACRDEVFVGRIRKDPAFENGLAMWIVADNVRKGAALNAVQIAELL